jgi:hypothetical protein
MKDEDMKRAEEKRSPFWGGDGRRKAEELKESGYQTGKLFFSASACLRPSQKNRFFFSSFHVFILHVKSMNAV